METADKNKFRTTKEWKLFRKSLMEERGCYCELCGGKYSGKQQRKLQLHHIDPDNYTNLDPEEFKFLCSSDHDLVERIAKKLLSKQAFNLRNKKLWYSLLKDFLPKNAIVVLERMIKEESND